jgi:hypothetical protein
MTTKPTQSSLSIAGQLHTGINAARAGQSDVARAYLNAVLAQESDNIPAMLWLAFIAETPQESIQFLENVLEVDPENERAISGLRWAKSRLGIENETDVSSVEDEITVNEGLIDEEEKDDEAFEAINLRQQLFTKDYKRKGRKSILAHRARRTINPFLVLLVTIILTAAMTSIGVGSLRQVSADSPTHYASSDSYPRINPETPPEELDIFTIASQINAVRPASRIIPIEPPNDSSSFDPNTLAALETVRTETPIQENTVDEQSEDCSHVAQSSGCDVSTVPTLYEPVDFSLLAYQPDHPNQKWVEVDTNAQRVTAWEGNIPVMSFLASTGLQETPTITGEFHVYWKLESAIMTGENYYLPDVPYTMYFYDNYGIHGTYWHNNFGRQMSRGCVNLSIEDAKQLFEWVGPVIPAYHTEVTSSWYNPGTLVVVHN